MKLQLVVIFAIFNTILFAQDVWLHPNVGQWEKPVLYKVELQQGEFIAESDGFTYFFHDFKQSRSHTHSDEKVHIENEEELIKAHVVRAKFRNANWQGKKVQSKPSSFYRNYFLGADSSNWKGGVYAFAEVELLDFYPGIAMKLEGSDKLKYSFIVSPGKSTAQIQYEYSGAEHVYLDERGNLHVKHRFGEIIEQTPVAWTEGRNGKERVEVQFILDGNRVSFQFPQGYDQQQVLVIDPYLVFSTFTGSTADNWGFTAAPDPSGNLFAGGIVFAAGYPTTTGAFDVSYDNGTESGFNIDVGISKFNTTGTTLLYSTYLGGNKNETPNSIVCTPSGELYVFGITASANFPIGAGAYDNSFNGGPTVTGNSLTFSGTDIYIAKFNAAGTALTASTFIGGTGTDGFNLTNLNYNYGDQFRGEIILDAAGNVYVASTTQSTNFPVVLGSQGALNGSQDAVIFKMSSNLSSLLWSTYFGGSGNETGNSVQIASNGNVLVAGGTTSNTIPVLVGNDLTYNGGLADGYVLRINGATGATLSGSYMGFGEYDQAYFVQLDISDEVYVFGQSQSAWPITPGKFGVPNSGQFIQKYTADLQNILWTTMIGAGTGNVEISPTAFLVSDCYDIYLSGWGGSVNQASQATFSTSSGFPVTPDAFQAGTNGSNFYIGVLSQNATTLKYATYMGGTASSFNHVDGGTSRFDKSGRIYHAVCGACGGNPSGFTSTPGVWSPINRSTNCNLAAFKFELSTIEAVVSEPQSIVCLPDPVVFNNNSSNGNTFLWNFGDGNTSTAENPSHLYSGPGIYTVTLVVSDNTGCFSADSVQFTVTIGDFQGGVVQPSGTVCPGEPFQLEAFGGSTYLWSPANVLNDPTSATPIATVYQTTNFTVIVSDSCGTDTLELTLPVYGGNSSISNDTIICLGNSVPLFASGGVSYNWTPATGLDDPNSATPVATPDNSVTYIAEILTSDGCILRDSVEIVVYFTLPIPVMEDSMNLCFGSSAQLTVSGGNTYLWSPNSFINTTVGPTVMVNPPLSMYYYCDFTNACGTVTDSIYIHVRSASVTAGNDTIICPGESTLLWANGGISYNWFPAYSLNTHLASQVIATPDGSTMYRVIGTDQYGCVDTAFVTVLLYPRATIQTNPDVYAIYGDQVQLSAQTTTPGTIVWSPGEFLSCVVCPNPIAVPNKDFTYVASYTDQNGCSASDIVKIFYKPILYIPNTFTPDEDNINNFFRIYASNIKSYELLIFNRWGELIHTMDDFDDFWDGTFLGKPVPDGTYIWRIKYFDFNDEEYHQVGHVNVLR